MKVAQTLCRRARVAVAHRLVQTLLLAKPFVQYFVFCYQDQKVSQSKTQYVKR